MNEEMTDGILLVDKPAGISSFGVVARVRRRLSQAQGRKVKVGHTGTLDPFATGLMILVIGKECKNAERYSKLDKVYEATVTLGSTSTTGDPEGELSVVSTREPSEDKIREALMKFRGTISQTPPAYSAIKVGGQRAYKLAREGKEVQIPTRQVTIHTLDLLAYDYPQLKLRAHVSSGTYIRSLAEDIGQELGTGAYCSGLRRTRISDYDITDAILLPADDK
jgi:tRNA pseudouridine55 synthase